MMHRCASISARLAAALLGLACCAAAFAQSTESVEKYFGRKFWYEPEHAKYAHVEFLRLPTFNRGHVRVNSKSRFEVKGRRGIFLQLRFEDRAFDDSIAFLPLRTFRSRLYTPNVAESFLETFQNAAFFEEDPGLIKRRLQGSAVPAAKSPAALPPWQIRNRGPLRPMLPAEPEPEPPAPQ